MLVGAYGSGSLKSCAGAGLPSVTAALQEVRQTNSISRQAFWNAQYGKTGGSVSQRKRPRTAVSRRSGKNVSWSRRSSAGSSRREQETPCGRRLSQVGPGGPTGPSAWESALPMHCVVAALQMRNLCTVKALGAVGPPAPTLSYLVPFASKEPTHA